MESTPVRQRVCPSCGQQVPYGLRACSICGFNKTVLQPRAASTSSILIFAFIGIPSAFESALWLLRGIPELAALFACFFVATVGVVLYSWKWSSR